ncbi:unnamed protein product [Jaminaea pallidilutea]
MQFTCGSIQEDSSHASWRYHSPPKVLVVGIAPEAIRDEIVSRLALFARHKDLPASKAQEANTTRASDLRQVIYADVAHMV